MGRLFKIILSVFASLFLLVIIAVIVLPLIIDPNDFKPEIQTAVKDNLGRELSIEGDLELSVFPWVGFSTGKLKLSNASGFGDKSFAEISESNIKVKLFPLLSKELEISRVILKGLALNLAKNKQGLSNWDDLTSSGKAADKTKASDDIDNKGAAPLAALAIGGIAIEQAKIIWDDQQKGQYIEINDFNFKTGQLAFDEPIDMNLSLTVVNKEPALTESLKFSTALIVNKQLDNFKLNSVDIESITTGKSIPGEQLTTHLLTDIAVNLDEQTLAVSGLKLSAANVQLVADIMGTGIIDNPVFKGPIKINTFNLAQLMNTLAVPLPKMQDPNALSKFGLSFNLLATKDSASIQDLDILLDDTSIKGNSNIKNFTSPAIAFNFNINTIDVDRYKAPVDDDKSSKPVVTPASAAAATATLFPVKTLRELNAKGQVTIGQLKINNLKMQGLSLILNAKNGLIKTQQTVKQLYQGAYTGNTAINVKSNTPTLSLNEKLANVQIEPLLQDMLGVAKITGLVNAKAIINGRGNTTKAIKSTLNGNVDFNFKDGLIRGFNLQKMIDNGKALLKGTALPTENKNDQTVFSVIKGSAKINQGLVSNNDLYAEASKLRVNGHGNANLVSEKLDYKVNAKLLKTAATTTEAEKLQGIPVIIKVGGTLAKPTYQLDVAAMLLEKNKDKINEKKDELLRKLDEQIAPGVGDLIKGFF